MKFCWLSIFAIIFFNSLNAQIFELVKDINPTGPSYPSDFILYNGKLFFTAQDTVYNNFYNVELWSTDGTDAGTSVVKEIHPTFSSSPKGLVQFNGLLYFSANDNVIGNQMWSSGGTLASTIQRTSISPSFGFEETIESNGDLLINNGSLWKSDGTTNGTQLVKNLTLGSSSSSTAWFTNLNGKTYFTASGDIRGHELWVTDGTDIGTQLVKDYANSNITNSNPAWLTEYNGLLYFSAHIPSQGVELCVSDGTTVGSLMLIDLNASGSSNPSNFFKYNGKLFFTADNGADHVELWCTDGTTIGTQMIKDINPNGSAYPHCFIEYQGKIFFSAVDDIGMGLWSTDGTTAGTKKVVNLNYTSGYTSYAPTIYNGTLYFIGQNSNVGRSLWRSDGTASGTYVVSPGLSNSSSPLSFSGDLKVYNGSLYFQAQFDSSGYELWKLTTWPASAASINSEIRLEIYPNPAKTFLKIGTEKKIFKLTVIDCLGKQLIVNETGTNYIDVSNLSYGQYFVQVQTKDNLTTKKFVKK